MRLWIVSGRMKCKKEDTLVIMNHRNSFIIDLLAYSPRTIQTSHWSLQNSSRYKTIVSMGSKMCKKWKHGFFFLILLKPTFGSHTHTHTHTHAHTLSLSLSLSLFLSLLRFWKAELESRKRFFEIQKNFSEEFFFAQFYFFIFFFFFGILLLFFERFIKQ